MTLNYKFLCRGFIHSIEPLLKGFTSQTINVKDWRKGIGLATILLHPGDILKVTRYNIFTDKKTPSTYPGWKEPIIIDVVTLVLEEVIAYPHFDMFKGRGLGKLGGLWNDVKVQKGQGFQLEIYDAKEE